MRKQILGHSSGDADRADRESPPMANPKKIMAKAWDNRYGVGLALELVEALHKENCQHALCWCNSTGRTGASLGHVRRPI